MEEFDREKARRVWQRVQAGGTVAEPELGVQALAGREAAESNAYIRLSRQLKGKDSQLLRQIAMEDRRHSEVLKGICRMTDGLPPVKTPPFPESGNISQRLQLMYGRKLQLAAEYEKRAGHPRFGNIFEHLAQQEYAHCRMLLSLIGKY